MPAVQNLTLDDGNRILDFLTAKGIDVFEGIQVPSPPSKEEDKPPIAHLLGELDSGDNLILRQTLQLGRTKAECLKWLKLALQKNVNVYLVAEDWRYDQPLSSDLFVKLLAAVVVAESRLVGELTQEALATSKESWCKTW